ncbi:MAG: carboxypeptidase-like regulatory domain-containing protein, partial [Chitinophagaceae bacterium]
MKKHIFLFAFLIYFTSLAFSQVKPRQQVAKTQTYPQVSTSTAPQQASFSGRVFEQDTRNSLSGARVVVTNADSNKVSVVTETNADGYYRFTSNSLINFSIEVTKSGYAKYTSDRYNSRTMMANRQQALPDIYLIKNREGGTTDGQRPPNNPTQNPPQVKDTTPLPREEFLSKKLLNDFNVLPTASAYALYYALNPGLKDLSQVPPDYQIIRPHTTLFTSSLRKELSKKFSDDSEKDNAMQQALQDSVTLFFNVYDAFQNGPTVQFKDVNKDTTLKLLSIINHDLRSYESDIRSTRKAKNKQLINVVATCTGLIKNVTTKRVINRDDFENLKGLSMYLSSLVASTSFINYFRRFLNESTLIEPQKNGQINSSLQFTSYHTVNPSNEENKYLLLNDSRAF